MNLDIIREFNSDLYVENNCEFNNLGFDLRQSYPKMLTYATTEYFFSKAILDENVSAIITSKKILDNFSKNKENIKKGIVISKNPELDFFEFHNFLAINTDFYKVDIGYKIGENSKISNRAILPTKNILIGKNVVIEENVIIRENTIIGDNVCIRAGTVIGGEGFQFFHIPGKKIVKIIHVGGVSIENFVEIQQLCAVDKHIFRDYTIVGEETKFDNYVHFAHGAKIGKRCRVAANAMIAGSALIGDDVWIGPSASISSAIRVGCNAFVTIGSVVTKDVPDGGHVSGNFAIDHKKFIQHMKNIR